MSATSSWWEIVCPDGRVRHYPYRQAEDAVEDARRAEEDCSLGYEEPSPLEQRPCPGGSHAARLREEGGA